MLPRKHNQPLAATDPKLSPAAGDHRRPRLATLWMSRLGPRRGYRRLGYRTCRGILPGHRNHREDMTIGCIHHREPIYPMGTFHIALPRHRPPLLINQGNLGIGHPRGGQQQVKLPNLSPQALPARITRSHFPPKHANIVRYLAKMPARHRMVTDKRRQQGPVGHPDAVRPDLCPGEAGHRGGRRSRRGDQNPRRHRRRPNRHPPPLADQRLPPSPNVCHWLAALSPPSGAVLVLS